MSRIALILIIFGQTIPQKTAQMDLDKIYSDQSHCLTGTEIRSEKDNAISCYCRDAIVDAHYVYHTYGFSIEKMDFKDPNLKGTILTLESNAREMCKDKKNALEANTNWVHKAMEDENWKWSGPEVTRTYPSASEIDRIKPDSRNLRKVPVTVSVIYRDSNGRIVRTETFSAHELKSAK